MEETKGDLKRVFRHARSVAGWLIFLLVLLYLASGSYSVKPEQRGVVKRFGQVVNDNVLPGIHYRWPWPIESVIRLRTTEIRSLTVSFGHGEDSQEEKMSSQEDLEEETPIWAEETDRSFSVESSQAAEETSALLTGDENLVITTLMIQYMISEPKGFLYNTEDAEGLLRRIVQAAIVNKVVSMSVDKVLTTGRFDLQKKVNEVIMGASDSYGMGVRIASVQIKNIQPPAGVASAFRDVSSAREDMHKFIQEAQGNRNRRLPRARSEAMKMRTEAAAHAKEVVEMAHGDGQRFLAAWEEYRKAKTVTAYRFYMEAMEEILPRVRKLISDPETERYIPFPRTSPSQE